MAAKNTTIYFFKEKVRFRLSGQEALRSWIGKAVWSEKYKLVTINYIFCSDKYLLQMNKEYLQHDYFTDIITFDNSTEKKTVEGDIFISVDSVKRNAKTFGTTFEDELHRVMIHGVLHLLGYKDKTAKDKAVMRRMENAWLLKL